jgi:hypothetical protein
VCPRRYCAGTRDERQSKPSNIGPVGLSVRSAAVACLYDVLLEIEVLRDAERRAGGQSGLGQRDDHGAGAQLYSTLVEFWRATADEEGHYSLAVPL